MKRRTLIAGLGTLTVSSIFAVGSGAFTSVSAERTVTVDVADDNRALLKLEEVGSGRRSFKDGSTVAFDIPSPEEDDYGGTDPEGVGTDSVYRFGGDAAHDRTGLFTVANQGTQSVEVYATQQSTEGVPTVVMYDAETGDRLTKSSPSDPLAVGGDPLPCGLEIDTHGVPVKEDDPEYEVTLTITAVATDAD
ncbi:uncharacterized protein HHUB_3541 [Halobacterium hubeiense]|uniref:Uncharacterized protein n=1 Tax=Halobacterium hubeiense TaxID=1407499 RepID=A0A0U5H678_9EURY|nr:hypothetical protein [Halobacterium hubeiense]CQH61771.1 uncharacterized protein HHUB_3541 [Halobacterium hubeiense]